LPSENAHNIARLMTAAAAATAHTCERRYFMAELLRFGLTFGLCDWPTFKRQCILC